MTDRLENYIYDHTECFEAGGFFVTHEYHATELATLREELAAAKRKFERAKQERTHAEIERNTLREQVERMRKALEKIAAHCNLCDRYGMTGNKEQLRIAKEALK